jgi:Uma2 family endonuclease
MVQTLSHNLTLEEFLQFPETKPLREYINGQIIEKPMPKTRHSRLQSKIIQTINNLTEDHKIAYAFPELRCTFGGRSMVPDVVVFEWGRIPRTEKGRIANRFNIHPDWSVEILSPHQSYLKVLDNLLFCSQAGTKLGWLIHPDEEFILVVFPEQKIKLFKDDDVLPMLASIDLLLKVNDIFDWLNL